MNDIKARFDAIKDALSPERCTIMEGLERRRQPEVSRLLLSLLSGEEGSLKESIPIEEPIRKVLKEIRAEARQQEDWSTAETINVLLLDGQISWYSDVPELT